AGRGRLLHRHPHGDPRRHERSPGGRLVDLRRGEPRRRRAHPPQLPPERRGPGRLPDHGHDRSDGGRDAGRHLALHGRLRAGRPGRRPGDRGQLRGHPGGGGGRRPADLRRAGCQPRHRGPGHDRGDGRRADRPLRRAHDRRRGHADRVAPGAPGAPAAAPIGPDVARTPAGEVTLTASPGAEIVDEHGEPLPGPVTDGTSFWLVSQEPGAATVTATAEATVLAGRAFAKPGVQRMILATTTTTTVDAEASGSWTTPPTTEPPTTEPPTTEPPTTEPPTTEPPTTEPP